MYEDKLMVEFKTGVGGEDIKIRIFRIILWGDETFKMLLNFCRYWLLILKVSTKRFIIYKYNGGKI